MEDEKKNTIAWGIWNSWHGEYGIVGMKKGEIGIDVDEIVHFIVMKRKLQITYLKIVF